MLRSTMRARALTTACNACNRPCDNDAENCKLKLETLETLTQNMESTNQLRRG